MKCSKALGKLGVFFLALAFWGAFFVAVPQKARADADDPLLRVLIKKGILTPEEAAQVRAEVEQMKAKERKEVVEEVAKKSGPLPKALKGLKISGLGYIHYDIGVKPESGDREDSFNRFTLGRGYLTVKKQINDWLAARITSDITRKADGDWEYRLKYLYAEFKPHDVGIFTNMKIELGQGHNPWLDFQEHVNPYRAQGTMAIERAGVFNSADLGLSLRGNFGGKLADAKAKTGNHHYDGLYGSWHIGVYNGSGYHADEANNNKAVEARLTFRPLPNVIPGLQISYLGMFGEGNKDYKGEKPDYMVNLGYISLENPMYIFTAQYFRTTGNAGGSWVATNPDGSIKDELETEGYSFFGRVRMPFMPKLAVLARYDHFDQDKDDDIAEDTSYDLFIGGLSYDIYKGNMLMAVFQTVDYDEDAGKLHKLPSPNNNLGDDYQFQLVYQLKF